MDIQNEIWRDAVGYEGYYQGSTWGRVKSLWFGKERILKPKKNKNGYLQVNLYKEGKVKTFSVHRLIAMTFPDMVGWTEDAKGRPFEELEVNHKKEGLKEKANNHVENLEWCDRDYNIKYGTGIERRSKATSERLTGVYNTKCSKRVAQQTKDGELVKIWESTMEIQRQTGWNNGNISKCCRGERNSAHGFIWRYID